MIPISDSGIRQGRVWTETWTDAVATFTGTRLDLSDPGRAIDLFAAGMVGPDGVVREHWAEALQVARAAHVDIKMVAMENNIVFQSHVLAANGSLVTVLNRAENVGGVVKYMEPSSEVVLGPHHEAWVMVRRLLPKRDVWRRPPSKQVPVERLPRPLPGDAEAELTTDRQHEAIRNALGADSMLSAVISTNERLRTVQWFACGDRLHRAENGGLWTVGAGDVANILVAALDS